MRHLRVELLSLSPQLHKIHYNQRWSQNTVNKERERQQLHKSAGLHQLWDVPATRGLLNRLLEGWPMGQCLLQLHWQLGFAPKNARQPWWEKTTGQENGRAKLSQASSRNTKPSKTPSSEMATMSKGWAGKQKGQTSSVINKYLLQEETGIRRAHGRKAQDIAKDFDIFFWKIAKTWNISFHQDIKMWMMKSMSLLHFI